jgi:hypothetical protein
LFRIVDNEATYMAEYHEEALARNSKAPCLTAKDFRRGPQ